MKIITTNFAILDGGSQIDANNVFNIQYNDVDSRSITMQPNQISSLFSGATALSHDATTNYSITHQINNTYRFNFTSGTDPVFRTSRTHSGDNTTAITIAKSGNTMVLTNTAGAIPNFLTGGFTPGDSVEISNASLSNLNQGVFNVLLVKENELVVENIDAVAESFTLLNNSDLNGFSQAGVQIGNVLTITSNTFVNNGAFEITKVTNKYLEFTSVTTIASEGPYSSVNTGVTISDKSARLISIIASEDCSVTVDGVVYKIKKLLDQVGVAYSGQLFITGLFSSVSLNNTSINPNTIRLVIAG